MRSFLVFFLVAVSPVLRASHDPQTPISNVCRLWEESPRAVLSESRLSAFWAQEYVGGELAKRALEAYRAAGGLLVPSAVGVIDSGVVPQALLGPVTERFRQTLFTQSYQGSGDSHGTRVVNLINGAGPVGVGTGALDTFVVHTPGVDSLALMARAGVDIVNISQRRHDADWNENSLKSLAARSLIVWASGNSASHPVLDFPGVDVISVGSITQWGGISWFSQEGPSVDIMAPAEHPLQTSYDGQWVGFGGTSGAAPLVTGALTNVIAVLGPITTPEARVLLQRTAIPIPSSLQIPRRNGAGLVNALKLVRVAIRLKQRGWPANRGRLLEDASLYHFSGSDLPVAGNDLESNDCEVRSSGFRALQSSLLLTAGSSDADSQVIFEQSRRRLVSVLGLENLSSNADFYRGLDRDALAEVIEERIPRAEVEELWGIGRTIVFLRPGVAARVLLSLLHRTEIAAGVNAAYVFSLCHCAPEFAEPAYAHPSPEVRLALVSGMRPIPAHESILRRALMDSDPRVRQTAARRLAGELK